MARGQKLLALKKQCEAQEREALQVKSKVLAVYTERKEKLDALQAQRELLLKEQVSLSTGNRTSARASGDSRRLASAAHYLDRLKKELDTMEEKIAASAKEVASAQERLTLADEDLKEARIETKKVEKLIYQEEHSERVLGVAREEQQLEELNTGKK